MFSLEWSLGAEYWIGVESDFGVAKAEWIAVVMFYVTCEHNNIYEMTLFTDSIKPRLISQC